MTAADLFYPTCGARLRRRPGTCRRIVSTPDTRCPVHNGGELSDAGRAIISTAASARHAKQARAVARNELRRYPQGRKRKWVIPRPWRFALTEADEATVLMQRLDALPVRGRPPWQPHAGSSLEARALRSLETTFIERLNDRTFPLSLEDMEKFYGVIVEAEHELGLPGADVRLKRLAWERDAWIIRRTAAETAGRVASERARSPPVAPLPALPATRPTGLTPLRNQITPQTNQTAADPPVDPTQPAREFSELIVRAGQHAGAIRRGDRFVSDFAFTKSPGSRF